MRVAHISDTHGDFPTILGKYDLIIHSGDFFPNSKALFSGKRKDEILFQENWLKSKLEEIKSFTNNSPFLFVLGNHDFINPDKMEIILNENNIKSINLTNKRILFNDVSFYGFPYIPYMKGFWNYEKTYSDMEKEINKMVENFNENYTDVLVSHAPIYGVLDLTNYNENIGNSSMLNALQYKIKKEMLPQYFLCGHCHENYGLTIKENILISNAATTQNIINIY